ncbi:hypothetical protein [Haloferula helveola]
MKTIVIRFCIGGVLPVLCAVMTSCGWVCPEAVDHRQHEKTPDHASTKIWRGLAKSNGWSSERAFYGNWGGPGNRGGKPVDEMDEMFRRHDIVYYEARSGCCLRAADRALAEALKSIDTSELDRDALAFRERAIRFFESPWSRVVGKPMSYHVRMTEPDWSRFDSSQEVFAFFDPDSSGMLEEPRPVTGSETGIVRRLASLASAGVPEDHKRDRSWRLLH